MLRPAANDTQWANVYTLILQDGNSLITWQNEQGEPAESTQATYEVVGDVVRFTYPTSSNDDLEEVHDIQWRLDDEGLHFHLAAIQNAYFDEVGMKAVFEAKPWQKIGEVE